LPLSDRKDVLKKIIRESWKIKYRVSLKKTEEGYSVSCPGLPGCWSQGKTEEEAPENIRGAIETYLSTVEELAKDNESRFVEVAI